MGKKTDPTRHKARSIPWIRIATGMLLLAGFSVFLWLPPSSPTSRSVAATNSPTAAALPDAAVFSKYAGSAACRDCHATAYEQWSKSHHGLAELAATQALAQPAFARPRSFPHGSQSTAIAIASGQKIVVTPGLAALNQTNIVERMIGIAPLQQFLVPAPGGRLQTLEASYDPAKDEWFNVYGQEDRKPGEWGHWTGRGMNWNSMCAYCHNTRLRKHYDEATDHYATTQAESAVGCEACHGPQKQHVDWQLDASKSRKPSRPDPTAKKLSRDQMFDACGTCHSRRQEITGEFEPGDSFFDHFDLVLPDRSDTYHPDGQVRDENYEFAAFYGSRMHGANVRCVDCHLPHSSKLLFQGNLLCMRCHNGGYPNSPVIDPSKHSHHQPGSTGDACVNCHMPQTTYMQRHPRRDHGFTTPDPLLTRELGIPNACNRCHADKTVDWALQAAEEWYGAKLERPSRRRTRGMALARRGDPAAKPILFEALAATNAPYWQATALGMLDGWLDDANVTAQLMSAATNRFPIVRAAAIQALAPFGEAGSDLLSSLIRAALSDSSRAVRTEAAWALRGSLEASHPAWAELQETVNLTADQPLGQMRKGALFLSRQDFAQAAAHYQKAVDWDANSAPIRHELAVTLSLLGRPTEAITQLEAARRLEPGEAEYAYKLGLAYNEIGDTTTTRTALEEAVKLNPQHVRAWYNLGLARNQAGDTEAALDALLRAESAASHDASIPYARATILARLGRIPEARAAARRALEIDPRFAAAGELLQSLP